MENRVINAAILGAGTVGGGVYKLAQAMEPSRTSRRARKSSVL